MRNPIHNHLNGILADHLVLEQKLRHYHWNVTGPQFFALHAKFEEMYNQVAGSVDEVAERILTVGGEPVRTLAGALQLATIVEDGEKPGALEMVENLRGDLAGLRDRAAAAIGAAEAAGDRGTVNLLDGLCDELEKTVWMLHATVAPAAERVTA